MSSVGAVGSHPGLVIWTLVGMTSLRVGVKAIRFLCLFFKGWGLGQGFLGWGRGWWLILFFLFRCIVMCFCCSFTCVRSVLLIYYENPFLEA